MNFLLEVEKKLEKNEEEVLWKGQPSQKMHFENADFDLLCFWSAYLIGTIKLAITPSLGRFIWVKIVIIFGLLMASYMIVGRFFLKNKVNKKIWFLITEKKIISLVDDEKKNSCYVDYGEIKNLIITRNKKGYGYIKFEFFKEELEEVFSKKDINTGIRRRYVIRKDAIFGLEEVDKIADIIRDAMTSQKETL